MYATYTPLIMGLTVLGGCGSVAWISSTTLCPPYAKATCHTAAAGWQTLYISSLKLTQIVCCYLRALCDCSALIHAQACQKLSRCMLCEHHVVCKRRAWSGEARLQGCVGSRTALVMNMSG